MKLNPPPRPFQEVVYRRTTPAEARRYNEAWAAMTPAEKEELRALMRTHREQMRTQTAPQAVPMSPHKNKRTP